MTRALEVLSRLRARTRVLGGRSGASGFAAEVRTSDEVFISVRSLTAFCAGGSRDWSGRWFDGARLHSDTHRSVTFMFDLARNNLSWRDALYLVIIRERHSENMKDTLVEDIGVS